jgi:hypothetical protein
MGLRASVGHQVANAHAFGKDVASNTTIRRRVGRIRGVGGAVLMLGRRGGSEGNSITGVLPSAVVRWARLVNQNGRASGGGRGERGGFPGGRRRYGRAIGRAFRRRRVLLRPGGRCWGSGSGCRRLARPGRSVLQRRLDCRLRCRRGLPPNPVGLARSRLFAFRGGQLVRRVP